MFEVTFLTHFQTKKFCMLELGSQYLGTSVSDDAVYNDKFI